jgi:hypothetical protein
MIPKSLKYRVHNLGIGTVFAYSHVTLGKSKYLSLFYFGYIGAGDTFQMIVPSALNIGTAFFTGGSIVDFAIRDATDTITRASQGTAEMIFSGDIAASNSENPIVLDDYWQNLTITWSIGNNDMAFNIGGSKDGFAPVPEPATMLLLGTGLIGLAGLGRRKFKKFKI